MDYAINYKILKDKEQLSSREAFDLMFFEGMVKNDLEMYLKMHEYCIATGRAIPDYLQEEIDYLTSLLSNNNLNR